MPRNRYRAVAGAARRFFDTTGIPVPGFARRAHRTIGAALDNDRPDLRTEVKALTREVESILTEIEVLRQRVDRVETATYLDNIRHRAD